MNYPHLRPHLRPPVQPAPRTAGLRAMAAASLAPVLGLLAVPASGQTTIFGDWVANPSQELYVSPAGLPTNPGTLAQPLDSVTGALAAAAGNIGVIPVTINVLNGTYSPATGEVFPLTIPAHGVAIEAYNVGGGPLPLFTVGFGGGATEILLIDEVGTEDLPPSAIRGLAFANSNLTAGAAEIRIAVPAQDEPTRIAPEIRDCELTGFAEEGGPDFGLQMLGAANVVDETVFERNVVERIDVRQGIAGVDILGDANGVMAPLLRCNEIHLYETNVRIAGGGPSNQTRVQSNFIQAGEINVDLTGCAPFIVNNTIAFAQSDGPGATGITWAMMPTLGFANNILWNPNAVDVGGGLGIFATAPGPERIAFFNMDEDGTLFAATLAGVPNVFTIIPGGVAPDFVGGNFPVVFPSDLHLLGTSVAIGGGFLDPSVTVLPGGVSSTAIPFAPGVVDVRLDNVYDIDFEGRIQGTLGAVSEVDIGADEFTGDPAVNATRNATLVPTPVVGFGTALDLLGNLSPDAGGMWNTQVDIVGNPGDFFILLGSFGFADTATSATGAIVENRFIYQNQLFGPAILAGLTTLTNVGLQAGPNTLQLSSGFIPAGGTFTQNITLGMAGPGLFEAETHLQAIVFDPLLTAAQSTTRLHIELNE
ncbi:MAG: DUF1565 domain-containing protein [Planctomycetota bacterium]